MRRTDDDAPFLVVVDQVVGDDEAVAGLPAVDAETRVAVGDVVGDGAALVPDVDPVVELVVAASVDDVADDVDVGEVVVLVAVTMQLPVGNW